MITVDLVEADRVDDVQFICNALTTRIGHAMVASYEMIFTPAGQCHLQQNGDAVRRRTGIKKHDFLSRNPEIANLFQDYVQNCVMGDIYLNHKYTLEELMASARSLHADFFPPQSAAGRLRQQ
ncbi:conjugal transfer protein TraG N-terminal domain-containing protein [Escherichia coli]